MLCAEKLLCRDVLMCCAAGGMPASLMFAIMMCVWCSGDGGGCTMCRCCTEFGVLALASCSILPHPASAGIDPWMVARAPWACVSHALINIEGPGFNNAHKKMPVPLRLIFAALMRPHACPRYVKQARAYLIAQRLFNCPLQIWRRFL